MEALALAVAALWGGIFGQALSALGPKAVWGAIAIAAIATVVLFSLQGIV